MRDGAPAAEAGRLRPGGLTEKRFAAGAVSLNYAEGPTSGPPMVLLHGLTSWWRTFQPVIPDLSFYYRLFAPDLRGCGLSGRATGAYRVTDYAGDIAEFLAGLFDEPVVLVGHSLGAHIGLTLAARSPERIAALILEDIPLRAANGQLEPQPSQPNFGIWQEIVHGASGYAEILAAVEARTPEADVVGDRLRARTLDLLDPDVLDAYVDRDPFEGYDPHGFARALACPTLVMQADPSVMARLDDSGIAAFAALNPLCTTMTTTGAGHSIHADKPKEWVSAVLGFLTSL